MYTKKERACSKQGNELWLITELLDFLATREFTCPSNSYYTLCSLYSMLLLVSCEHEFYVSPYAQERPFKNSF